MPPDRSSHRLARSSRAAVETARAAGVRVSFDPNHRGALWPPQAAAVFRDLAMAADLLFGGQDEAGMIL